MSAIGGKAETCHFALHMSVLTKSGVSLDANYSSLTQVGSGTLFNRSGSLSNPSNHDIHASRDHSREVNLRERFMQRELAAEFIGTFTLVSAVCGAALFSAPSAGLMAVAFAVGLSVLAMAFAVGPISGGHFNPAVTCGMVAAQRFPASRALCPTSSRS